MERRKLKEASSPHVLSTESHAKLEKDRAGIRAALNPRNAISEIYAEEFASENWISDRYRRGISQRVKKRMPYILDEILLDLDGCDPVQTAILVDGWTRADPDALAKVRLILKKHGISEQDVEGEAVFRCQAEIVSIEQILISSMSRRDRALTMANSANQLGAPQSHDNTADAIADDGVVRLEQRKNNTG